MLVSIENPLRIVNIKIPSISAKQLHFDGGQAKRYGSMKLRMSSERTRPQSRPGKLILLEKSFCESTKFRMGADASTQHNELRIQQ